MPKLATIKQPESLARMAYEAIRQSILSGQWQIGELYNEKAIAADLGISRHRSEKRFWNLPPRISLFLCPEGD